MLLSLSDAVGPQPCWAWRSLLGRVRCIYKCFAVCKTLSYPFFPLNLRAAQRLSRRDNVTGTRGTGTEAPNLPRCYKETVMLELNALIPTSLTFPPGLPHFKWSMLSLSRDPERDFPPFFLKGTWAVSIDSVSCLFFEELPLLDSWWTWCLCHQEIGSESPSWASTSCHLLCPEKMTCIWQLRKDRLSTIHQKRRAHLFLLPTSTNTPGAVLLEARNSYFA